MLGAVEAGSGRLAWEAGAEHVHGWKLVRIVVGNIGAQTAIEREAERLGTPLATTLERADTFWPAEDYHQAYLEKGGQSAAKGEQTPIRCYG